MPDGFQELSLEKLQNVDGVRELNRMLQYLFLKTPANGDNRDVTYGYGTPENAVAKAVGAVFLRLDGGASTTLYVKTSGTGATGWTAFSSSSGKVVQIVESERSDVVTCATTGNTYDDSIPAITDGVQILSRAITPFSATNILYFFINGNVACDVNSVGTVHLHKDGGASTAATAIILVNQTVLFGLHHSEVAGGTSAQTWTVRLNPTTALSTAYVNGTNTGTRIFGGVASTKITIIEAEP